ncbi:MAG: InlB B-repeat-containing protein [Lachnospiraceae bacterium]
MDCSNCDSWGDVKCGTFTYAVYKCSGCGIRTSSTHYKTIIVCDKVVTSLTPASKSQTLLVGETPNVQATATFLDGHTETVTCSYTGFNATDYNVEQTVTLSYGEYHETAKNAGPKTATITVKINGYFNLTVTSDDINKGSVSGSSGSILCGDSCTVKATAKTGYIFAGWYNGSTKVSDDASYTFSMPANDYSLVAKFSTKSYALTIKSESSDKGTVSGSSGTVAYNTSCTVTATAKAGYSFAGWYAGSDRVSTAVSFTFTMPAHAYELLAKFTTNSYVVSFNAVGGTACSAKTIMYNDTYGELPVPEKTGYVFLGWKYDGNYVTAASVMKVASDHTLTAEWVSCGPVGKTVTYDNTYGNLPTPQKLGYSFTGWFDSEKLGNGFGNRILATTIVKKAFEHTLHAGWTPKQFTVTFDSNGGTPCDDMTVYYDRRYGYVSALPVPTRPGYTFAGWYLSETDNNGEGTEVNSDTRVQAAANHTLYARWTTDIITLTVAFDACGGTVSPASKTVTYGGTYGTLPTPVWSNHTFVRWYRLDGTVKTTVTSDSQVTRTTGHTLYAEWTANDASFIVKSKVNGAETSDSGAKADIQVFREASSVLSVSGQFLPYTAFGTKCGDRYEIRNIVPKTGYRYSGASIVSGTLSAATTVYLEFTAKTYTVTLDANGGTLAGSATLLVTYASDTSCNSGRIPTRTGHAFAGWYDKPEGGTQVFNVSGVCTNEGTYWSSDKWIYDGDVTLYAHWTPDTYNFSVSALCAQLNSNGQLVAVSNDGKMVNRFGEVAGTFDVSVNGVNKADNVTSFHATLSYGDDYLIYDVRSADGYRIELTSGSLSGTVTNACSTQFVLTPEHYTLYFDVKGGTMPEGAPAHYETYYKESVGETTAVPTKTGYTFTGWYDADGVQLFDATGKKVNGTKYWKGGLWSYTGNVTMYAKWKANTYTMTLHANGGILTGAASYPVTYDADDSHDLSGCIPTLTGYDFTGWYTKEGEIQIYRADGLCANDGTYWENNLWKYADNVELYAKWKAKKYNITLDGRGATYLPQSSVTQTFDHLGADISIPEKTGYSFCGYFTGTRGTGTKYYDAEGRCIKVWTEDNCTTLFACWTQDDIVLPEEGDKGETTPVPEKEISGCLGRTDGTVLLYADDYNVQTGARTDLQPYLVYDISADGTMYEIAEGAKLLSEGAVPSTEQLSIRGKVGAWMLYYRLKRCSGIESVSVYVTVPYRTQYEKQDETLVISERRTMTYAVKVPKVWSYWEISESGLYYPKEVRIENDAFEEGEICIPVMVGEKENLHPEYTVKAYGGKEEHIRWETYDADGSPRLELILTKEEYIISDVIGREPEVETHLRIVCENAARNDNRQCEVRSDFFSFFGKTVLTDEYRSDGNGAEAVIDVLWEWENEIPFTEYEQCYCSGVKLNKTAENGEYKTSASVVYVGSSENIGAEEQHDIELTKVNSIRLHTPVVCKGSIITEEEKTVDGEELPVIVLRDEANFFEVSISNKGLHRLCPGYGEQDFRYALSGKSNIAEADGKLLNQVRFPFDVFLDTGNDSQRKDGNKTSLYIEGDILVEAGKWITIGEEKQKFCLPVSQQEGLYRVDFRTVAVNYPRDEFGELLPSENADGLWQKNANTDPRAYVAYDVMNLEVRGCAYGFELLKTQDTAAQERMETEHAVILKKGYPIAFRLRTNGSFFSDYPDISYIRIVPTYDWISEDGSIRKPIKLYYSEAIGGKLSCFVEVGGKEDAKNKHSIQNTDTLLGIESAVLKRTEALLGDNMFYGRRTEYFTYSELSLNRYLRMFPKRENVFLPFQVKQLELAVQEWYGMFYLPARIYAVPADLQINGQYFDLNEYAKQEVLSGEESFFLKDGYIAVNFKIEAVNRFGNVIAYDAWKDSDISIAWEKDGLPYREGDAFCYYLNRGAGEDYEVGGVE